MIKLFADFNNADALGRVRLNCQGSLDDIKKKAVQLHEGLTVILYAEDVDDCGISHELTTEGILTYSQNEKCWVAAIDWSEIQVNDQDGSSHDKINGISNGQPQLPVQSASAPNKL